MGGEMLYILRQRLDAQDIPEEKSRKGETPFCDSRPFVVFSPPCVQPPAELVDEAFG